MTITIITGEFSGKREERLRRLGWGRCYIERPVRPYENEPWIYDNGAFRANNKAVKENPGAELLPGWEIALHTKMVKRWEKAYLAGLDPLFAVAPDLPFMGLQSLDDSLFAMLELRDRFPCWRWFVAVQDDVTVETLMQPAGLWYDKLDPAQLDLFTGEPTTVLDFFDGIFLGGSDDFKAEQAGPMSELAHAHGKQCHYGRASTPRKLAEAINAGCDSCDSAFILWTDERFVQYAVAWTVLTGQFDPQLIGWLNEGAPLTAAA